ncbi:peptidylprolyl isomerase [Myxococcus sp. K15C18031901]|uniref:peptidylprolyl isomerase n=1 Tax=Myxococcus dinghuensis TaxID=2906761 RepID=UPI0020A6FC39|nr:peptidylprolyl isomerase [Myxococcus dinghuensis]MCP3097904.1 peptidylprolyl isomerase [Myxococcus dinghuensis]
MSGNQGTQGSGRGVERLLKISPVVSTASAESLKLPDVKAPPLDGLSVRVPTPEDLTEEDLLRRFHEKRRELAATRERQPGESLEMGDNVQLNIVGYCDGALIPFSARFGMSTELAPIEALPGFCEAVAEGGKVGESMQIALELPEAYPVEGLQGKPARFLVDVVAAEQVTMQPESAPEFLTQLGMGGTLDEVMDNIREELEDELAAQLWVQARDMVLDEVARRAPVDVPRALVDEELRRRWVQAEGQGMVAYQFDVEEQQEALRGWLTDPTTRADTERRLHIGIALKAVTEAEKLQLTPEKLEHLIFDHAEPFGFSAEDVHAALRESPETTRRLTELGWYLLAVEHVMNKAKVTFEGAEEG